MVKKHCILFWMFLLYYFAEDKKGKNKPNFILCYLLKYNKKH